MTVLHIEYPEDLRQELGQTQQDLEALAREALLVRLYDLGQVSSGKAAEVLGMSRRAFLDLLGKYNVSEFDPEQDVEQEARRAADARGLEHQSPD